MTERSEALLCTMALMYGIWLQLLHPQQLQQFHLFQMGGSGLTIQMLRRLRHLTIMAMALTLVTSIDVWGFLCQHQVQQGFQFLQLCTCLCHLQLLKPDEEGAGAGAEWMLACPLQRGMSPLGKHFGNKDCSLDFLVKRPKA
eukprot:s2816_g8.t1